MPAGPSRLHTGPKSKARLDFHPRYAAAKPGAVVLQADDDKRQCFYFQLPFLATFSSFFRNLPTPPPHVTQGNGPRARMPLPEATSAGLCTYLDALHSIIQPTPFTYNKDHFTPEDTKHYFASSERPTEAVLNAAVIAKLYDTPVVFRILIEGLRKYWHDHPLAPPPWLDWAIWAISGSEAQTHKAADATLGHPLAKIPPYISTAVKRHAGEQWRYLQELHRRGVSRREEEPPIRRLKDGPGPNAQKLPVPIKMSGFTFHGTFASKKAGDVILQADDESQLCFYFPFPLVRHMSNPAFIPSPTTGTHDDTPIIPMRNTSSAALHIFLTALRSTQSADPCNFCRHLQSIHSHSTIQPIVEAAVLGKTLNVHYTYRLLVEGLQQDPLSPPDPFLLYAITTFGGDANAIAITGQDTLGHDITKVPKCLADTVIDHAPREWIQLQSLHLRHALGPARFLDFVPRYTPTVCTDCGKDGTRNLREVKEKFGAARTAEEIIGMEDAGFGLGACEGCWWLVQVRYGDRLAWLRGFCFGYRLDLAYEDYL